MQIRQRTNSYILNIIALTALWVVGTYAFLSNDGFQVIHNPTAGSYQRLLPFAMTALVPFTLWMAKFLLIGGVYAVLDDAGVKITGIVLDRRIAWNEIKSIFYKLDTRGNVKFFKISMHNEKWIKSHTGESSISGLSLKNFLDRHGVDYHLIDE